MIDPEILEGFKEETRELTGELIALTDQLEEAQNEFPKKALEEFAQKIDRIMGTVNTMKEMDPNAKAFQVIGKLSGLCKALGYKASQLNHLPLVPIFAAFWADTVEVIEEITNSIGNPNQVEKITTDFSPTLEKRLEWLGKKVVEHSNQEGSNPQSQIQVDALLKSFGI